MHSVTADVFTALMLSVVLALLESGTPVVWVLAAVTPKKFK